MLNNKKFIEIAGKKVGCGYPPYIVAELSGNHNGDLDRALKLVKLAKDNGADAVKLQTYTADTITINHDGSDFRISGGLWDGYTLYELYDKAHTPWEWHKKIFSYASEIGITVFSSPFDCTAIDFLEDLDVPAYKISSFEMVDVPLVRYAASKNKPLILSTGMAAKQEIEEVLDAIKQEGNDQIILLHCVSGYPTPVDEMNLKTIEDLSKSFGVIVGLSDHSLGVSAAISSVALGASFIEKHFIDSRAVGGVDSAFSIEPQELERLSVETKLVWRSLGEAGYNRRPSESANLKFRRSLYYVNDVHTGEQVCSKDVRSIRPGYGLPPKYLDSVIGKVMSRDAKRGEPVRLEDFES